MCRKWLTSLESNGQCEGEGGSHPLSTFHFDLPAVRGYDFLGDRQTKTGPIPRMRAWNADEAIKDSGKVLSRNSFARVLDMKRTIRSSASALSVTDPLRGV